MFKGTMERVEKEIERFLQEEPPDSGIYQTLRPLSAEARHSGAEYVLYLGCGTESGRPFFLFGLGNVRDRLARAAATRSFKPLSFQAGFARMADTLFPLAGEAERRAMRRHFATAYRAMIGGHFSAADRGDWIDPALLEAFGEETAP